MQGEVRLRRDLEQLVGSCLRGQRRAVRVRRRESRWCKSLSVNVANVRFCLAMSVGRQQRIRGVIAAAITDGDGLQRIAVGIDRQRHCMADARIGELLAVDVVELALVVVVDRLARMGEEHRVPVSASGCSNWIVKLRSETL